MKIESFSGITAAEGAASQGGAKPPAASSKPERQGDWADLSSLQSRVSELTARVNQLPEIRQEKVTALTDALRQGTYGVSPQQTAEAILSEFHAPEGSKV